MQNPFSKMSPQMAAFISGLLGALLAALCDQLKTGQPLTLNLVVYGLASALGAYLVKNAIPTGPAAPAAPPAISPDAEAK